MNDADRAAAVADAPAVRHWVLIGRNRNQVKVAALVGNSQTDAASEFRV